MRLKMFQSTLPYFGNKQKLCPITFKKISEYLPREKWPEATFVDAFLGSAAVSLYAKGQGFRVIGNDIAERSFIAGKALIENNHTLLTDDDLHRLCFPHANGNHLIEKQFCPDVFPLPQALFLDTAFANARTALDKFLLLKYIFAIRPFSKFSSPNAFNKPLAEGRWDEIKPIYAKHIIDNLKPPLSILKTEKNRINAGIFSNGHENRISKMDVFDFVQEVEADILYLDSPYAGTLAYEDEYSVIDRILGDEALAKSPFSGEDGMETLNRLLERCQKFPLWVISFGNAGGKNDLGRLVEMVSKHRQCKSWEFAYKHCEAMASEEHKQKCKEWLIIG